MCLERDDTEASLYYYDVCKKFLSRIWVTPSTIILKRVLFSLESRLRRRSYNRDLWTTIHIYLSFSIFSSKIVFFFISSGTCDWSARYHFAFVHFFFYDCVNARGFFRVMRREKNLWDLKKKKKKEKNRFFDSRFGEINPTHLGFAKQKIENLLSARVINTCDIFVICLLARLCRSVPKRRITSSIERINLPVDLRLYSG